MLRYRYITLQVAATYMGAVIGAGFASGQELVYFFVRYREDGFWGLLVAGILFAFFGMLTIVVVNYFNVRSYTDLTMNTLGPRVGKILDVWLTLFLFAGLCIMLAGSAAIFVEYLQAPFWLGLLLTLICLGAALIPGSEGVLVFNTCLIPVLAVITVVVSFLAVGQETAVANDMLSLVHSNKGLLGKSWLLASLLYVAYNMVIGAIVLASIDVDIRKDSLWGGMVGGCGLGLLGLVMVWAMDHYYPQVLAYEIPMLFVAGQVHPLLKFLYTMVLWFAMLTTASANAFSLAQRLSGGGEKYRQAVLAVLILALPFTGLSFAEMVANLYPVFGYAGLFVMAAIFATALLRRCSS